MQGRLFGLMAIRTETSEQMNHKIGGAAMARMLNLRDVLKLIDNRFNDGSFAHEKLVGKMHQAIGHILAQPCDQVESLFKE